MDSLFIFFNFQWNDIFLPKYKQGYTLTVWLSEWQTENLSNVNIFSIELLHLLHKKCSTTVILNNIRQTKNSIIKMKPDR